MANSPRGVRSREAEQAVPPTQQASVPPPPPAQHIPLESYITAKETLAAHGAKIERLTEDAKEQAKDIDDLRHEITRIRTMFRIASGLVVLIPVAIVLYNFLYGTPAPKPASAPPVKPPSADAPSR